MGPRRCWRVLGCWGCWVLGGRSNVQLQVLLREVRPSKPLDHCLQCALALHVPLGLQVVQGAEVEHDRLRQEPLRVLADGVLKGHDGVGQAPTVQRADREVVGGLDVEGVLLQQGEELVGRQAVLLLCHVQIALVDHDHCRQTGLLPCIQVGLIHGLDFHEQVLCGFELPGLKVQVAQLLQHFHVVNVPVRHRVAVFRRVLLQEVVEQRQGAVLLPQEGVGGHQFQPHAPFALHPGSLGVVLCFRRGGRGRRSACACEAVLAMLQ
mmetsp:Transcript_27867/g.50283  ORF Transcript_27867/g.50283 Transcript_27867/m.50283 type:complete len:265 (+) Transcript_27867:207-1001(+)